MTAQPPRNVAAKLTADELKIWNKSWVHDFSPLGISAPEIGADQMAVQLEKQGPIFRHIRDALARLESRPPGLCITCSDGLFGLYALKEGAGSIRIVDVFGENERYEPWHQEQSRLAARAVGLESKVTFETLPYEKIEGQYEFCVCVGVLQNFPNPKEVLARLKEIVLGPLVIHCPTWMLPEKELRIRNERIAKLSGQFQFVKQFTPEQMEEMKREIQRIEVEKHIFYQAPAEAREWGSRFSHDTLINLAVDAGWTVVNEKFGALPFPKWLDRGSSSLLCV